MQAQACAAQGCNLLPCPERGGFDRKELSGVENVALATQCSEIQDFLLGHTGVVPNSDNISSAQGRIRSGTACRPVVYTDHYLVDNL